MKIITVQQLDGVVEGILHDKEEVAKIRKEQFMGVSQDEIVVELNNRLGKNWMLKKEPPVKFTKEDIAAVANSRFYRKTGMKLLMAWAIVVLAFAMLTITVQLIPLFAYYSFGIATTIVFLYIYSKKQRQVRDELKQAVYGSDKVEAESKK